MGGKIRQRQTFRDRTMQNPLKGPVKAWLYPKSNGKPLKGFIQQK